MRKGVESPDKDRVTRLALVLMSHMPEGPNGIRRVKIRTMHQTFSLFLELLDKLGVKDLDCLWNSPHGEYLALDHALNSAAAIEAICFEPGKKHFSFNIYSREKLLHMITRRNPDLREIDLANLVAPVVVEFYRRLSPAIPIPPTLARHQASEYTATQ